MTRKERDTLAQKKEATIATNKGDQRKSKTVEVDRKIPIRDGSNSAMSTPLKDKVTMSPRGVETAKEQRQVKRDRTFDTLDDIDRTRRGIPKTKIIASHPNVEFTNIDSIDKEKRNNTAHPPRSQKAHGDTQKEGPKERHERVTIEAMIKH